jgi:hypothetical protein
MKVGMPSGPCIVSLDESFVSDATRREAGREAMVL